MNIYKLFKNMVRPPARHCSKGPKLGFTRPGGYAKIQYISLGTDGTPVRRSGKDGPMDKKQTGTGEQAAKKSGVLTNPIRNLIIAAIVCLALGVVFLAQPYFMLNYCGYTIGGLVCAIGFVYVLIYFIRKPVSGVYRSEFAFGAMLLAAGVYLIVASYEPDTIGLSISLRMIVTALGVLIAADGVIKLQYTFDLARMHFSGWWVGLLTSALGIALGVLMAIGLVDYFGVLVGVSSNNFLNAMLFLGIGFCANAVLDLITVILVSVRNHGAAKAEAAAAAAAAAAPTYYESIPAPVSQETPTYQPPTSSNP